MNVRLVLKSLFIGWSWLVGFGTHSLLGTAFAAAQNGASSVGPSAGFEVSFPPSLHAGPVTGRLFVRMNRADQPEPGPNTSPEYFGPDANSKVQYFVAEVSAVNPGKAVLVDEATPGFPAKSLKEIPAGDYRVKAYLSVYTEYHRADGHVIWALDQWQGMHVAPPPGAMVSGSQVVHFEAKSGSNCKLTLEHVVPSAPEPKDTVWVKNIKIQSKMLTQFWGRPIYLGATVLLPKDYAAHPERKYPVIYNPRNHYERSNPFYFTTDANAETKQDREDRKVLGYESGYEFYQAWNTDDFPKMIAVTLISPTPFYDFAAALNSENNGPYGDAIMQELIPYIEEHFRTIREPYARMLLGKSSGGRESFALEIFHPDFFGGAWVFYPWTFSFHHYFNLDIYDEKNAFTVDSVESAHQRQEAVDGSRNRYITRKLDGTLDERWRTGGVHDAVEAGRSGAGSEFTGSDNSIHSPVGDDGYPKPLFNKLTGEIDPAVAAFWRKHDLSDYLIEHWATLGPKVADRLHFYVGDGDQWFRNLAIHELDERLKKVDHPKFAGTFTYGAGKTHGWQPMTNAELVRQIAASVEKQKPR